MEIKRTQKEEQTSLISVKVGEKDYGEASKRRTSTIWAT